MKNKIITILLIFIPTFLINNYCFANTIKSQKTIHIVGRKLIKHECKSNNIDDCIEIIYLGKIFFINKKFYNYKSLKTNDKFIEDINLKIENLFKKNLCSINNTLKCIQKNIDSMIFYQMKNDYGNKMYNEKINLVVLSKVIKYIK